MRQDQKFEIERAFDLLPHVVGSSWAVMWFRLQGIRKPTEEEYREKVIEYFNKLAPLFLSFPDDEKFNEIKEYVEKRKSMETENILKGINKEVEKRYERYVDYG